MCTMDLSFELQEVLLVRPEGGERLGLTLCYETDAEDGLTDIFVDDIHPDGLAAADGRLRLGDQIIQVGVTKRHNFTCVCMIQGNSILDCISFMICSRAQTSKLHSAKVLTRPFCEKGIIKTVQMIPHFLCVGFQSDSLHYG